MKKLLCILLALSFILAGCSEEKEIHECDPRSCICVKDIGTLENMRETIEDESLDDQDFRAYIVEQEPGVIISEHQPLVQADFAELLHFYDNLQVPFIPDAKLTYMEFIPQRSLYLSYAIEGTGEEYYLKFSPYKSALNAYDTVEAITKSKPKCLYTNGSNININDNGTNSAKTTRMFCLDADGKYMSVGYSSAGLKDGSIKIRKMDAKDIFKYICLTPLCEIPWDNTEKTAQP